MNSILESLIPGFFMVNLGNSQAISVDMRLESAHKEPHLSFAPNEPEVP